MKHITISNDPCEQQVYSLNNIDLQNKTTYKEITIVSFFLFTVSCFHINQKVSTVSLIVGYLVQNLLVAKFLR